jgi:hypothetical protein
MIIDPIKHAKRLFYRIFYGYFDLIYIKFYYLP